LSDICEGHSTRHGGLGGEYAGEVDFVIITQLEIDNTQ
jgi:hypothetical protein